MIDRLRGLWRPAAPSWRCRTLRTRAAVSARQERIAGWDQQSLASSSVLLVGAGGLGGEVAEGLVQKGVEHVHIVDFDIVTPTNLNRQKFSDTDLWKNKALSLARAMRSRGFLGSRLTAHAGSFQGLDVGAPGIDVIVAAVDNQIPTTRLAICQYARKRRLPAVFTGATPDADGGYCFVQELDGACWSCATKPELVSAASGSATCPESPASVDILKVLGGIALYAIDTVVMERPRDWNLWTVSLGNAGFGGAVHVARRPNCPVCNTEEA